MVKNWQYSIKILKSSKGPVMIDDKKVTNALFIIEY